jgi:DNA polymerase III sliding clamp (beta) subunit (PCNA family)
MNGSELGQALKAAKQVGDLVNFSIDESSFKVHVRNSTDSVDISFDKDEVEELVCSGAARSQYSLTYLEPLSRRFGPQDSVTIQFGENFPLAMNFSFEDGAAEVDYFLAPRVESDY